MTARPGRLAEVLRDLVAETGPIPLDRFMGFALGHPALGYYMTRDPLGAGGDFTTAPEISQMFGELIGLWCAAVWAVMDRPAPLRLVELGPGRGTLMADALRAMQRLPDIARSVVIHLVETSPTLRDAQARALKGWADRTSWHAAIEDVPGGPAIIVANEFFDALPVRHLVRRDGAWHERLVGIDASGRFCFGLAEAGQDGPAAPEGSILEHSPAGEAVARQVAARLAVQGGAALVIDYGHTAPHLGETLQAVKAHRFVDPLAEPGEADLTAHVDFSRLARIAAGAGAATAGPVTQGAFLRGLGIEARAAALQRANPDKAETIAAALARLCDAGTPEAPGMGALFKVLAIAAPGLGPLPGFPLHGA